MQCPRCQAKNPADAVFCEECGARLDVACPSCGEPNRAGAKFCKKCGQPLVPATTEGLGPAARFDSPKAYTPKHLAEKILTSRSAIEGERKRVTVLFCDIANSTALAERIGPEAMHNLLNGFFELSLAGQHYFWLAHMYSRLGDQRRAAESARRAIEEAARCGDEITLGKAHGLLSLEGHWSGKPVEGIEHGERAIALLQWPGQQWWLGMAHFYVAMNHLLAGHFTPARNALAQAQVVGESISDPRLPCYAAFTAAWIEAARGEFEPALSAAQGSLKLAPDLVSKTYASMFLGYVYVEKEEWSLAVPHLERAMQTLEHF